MLSFGPDDAQMCINVFILEDVNVEDDEVFKLNLTSDDQAVLFSQNTAEVTITEDDDSELRLASITLKNMRMAQLQHTSNHDSATEQL